MKYKLTKTQNENLVSQSLETGNEVSIRNVKNNLYYDIVLSSMHGRAIVIMSRHWMMYAVPELHDSVCFLVSL